MRYPTKGKFGVILADPPWAFKTYEGETVPHRGETPYSIMSRAALEGLPVGEWAAPNAVLLLWIVDSHHDQGFAMAKHWGFKFKTIGFVWNKLTKAGGPKMGMGFWTRKETEQCYLFTKGHPTRLSAAVRQRIDAAPREHSRKPEEVYERVEALVGGPYLELFARARRKGWSSWGDEVGKYD